jgi:C_GCAxxG_C_C family probable redox protein
MYATKAKQLFEQGYACSQAVVLAFKDIFNIDEETLTKLTLPFGGGLGRLRLVCGAASGVAFVIGQIYGDLEKVKVYEITRTIMEQVEKVNGSLICKELLENGNHIAEIGGTPEQRTKEYYNDRPCSTIIYNTVTILVDYLRKDNKLQ